MLAWLNGWEVILILTTVLLIFSGNLGGGSGGGGGGGFGIHPVTVCGDILEWLIKAKEELWVRLGGKSK